MANNIFSKFAQKLHPKTSRIENKEVQTFIQQFKLLQEYAESMAKTAREIKRTLKTSKDVMDIEKIKNATKDLFGKNNYSIIRHHYIISFTLQNIAESLGMKKTADNLKLFSTKEKVAAHRAIDELSEETLRYFRKTPDDTIAPMLPAEEKRKIVNADLKKLRAEIDTQNKKEESQRNWDEAKKLVKKCLQQASYYTSSSISESDIIPAMDAILNNDDWEEIYNDVNKFAQLALSLSEAK